MPANAAVNVGSDVDIRSFYPPALSHVEGASPERGPERQLWAESKGSPGRSRRGLSLAWVSGMADKQIEKTAKVEDGKGVPPAAEPPRAEDRRLLPGGS